MSLLYEMESDKGLSQGCAKKRGGGEKREGVKGSHCKPKW